MTSLYAGCGHKNQNDHCYMTEGGRVWLCSNCGNRQKLGPNWGYHGNIECKRCGWARMDWVACSTECGEALAEAMGKQI